ncbi:hypothetical protein D3C71_727690 [compost metagenome]
MEICAVKFKRASTLFGVTVNRTFTKKAPSDFQRIWQHIDIKLHSRSANPVH